MRVRSKPIYFWKDIVLVNGVVTSEVFEIGEDYSTSNYIRDFIKAVANKYGVEFDDVKTYWLHGIEFNPQAEGVDFPKEQCGMWIVYQRYMCDY